MYKINWKCNISTTYLTCQLEHGGSEITDAPSWFIVYSAWNLRVNFLHQQHVHLFPSQLQVCYQAVFLTPPNLLGPEPLSNMFSIINLVKMEAARHPSDLLHAQAQPCSVHLHHEPSCCRAQKVRHTQQPTSRGLMSTGSLWSWLTGGDDSSTTRGWEKSGVQSGATCYVSLTLWWSKTQIVKNRDN